jgi:hypothetical protein
MAGKRIDPQAVEQEVAVLGGLPVDALRERWAQLFGSPPPKSLRREFLSKACAYQIQVKAFGGLSAASRRRLRAIADGARNGESMPATPQPKIKPGTRLVRAWGGKVHTVTAVPRGFEYQGQRYRSLSAIARTITGTSWNGRVFFGVNQPAAAMTDGAIGTMTGDRPR